ncbi:MAG: hypothetical protein Q9173_001851, partial [Seirophora scorigena]
MSSPEASSPVVITAQELLAFDEGRLIQFLQQCRVEGGGFDISRVANVDKLSGSQREEFSEKVKPAANRLILSSAADKAGPDPNELARRLWLKRPRSPTQSPVPESNNRAYETFCYDELVKASGRPVRPIELLLRTPEDPDADGDKLEPWLPEYKNPKRRDGDLPPVFSTQLKDWQLFQHTWQWDNRGKIACEEGFSAFLDWERKLDLHQGQHRCLADPWYEHDARLLWESEQRFFEASGHEGFKAYAQAVAKRLASHNFTQPFQLAEDPRQQDGWTTWVEYLNFVYRWHDKYAANLKAFRPEYRKAWEEFDSFLGSAIIPPKTGTTDEQLSACRAWLERLRRKTTNYFQEREAYQRAKSNLRRQKLRVQWVLEQLPMIEPGTSLKHKTAKNATIADNSRKRKLRDSDDDTQTGHQSKRRGQGVGGGNKPSGPNSKTGIESGIVISRERASTPA